MRILKLHLGLVRYILNELPKQKGLRKVVKFFLNLSKAYSIAILNEYRLFLKSFDTEYRNQIKKQKKNEDLRKKLYQALKLLQYIETKMSKEGISRQRRRQFWREFYGSGQIRKEVFEELLKEIR